MITFWSMVLWILGVAALGAIGYAVWWTTMCLGFFLAMKRTNDEHARAQVLAAERITNYPKIRAQGRGFDLLEFSAGSGLGMGLVIRDDVKAWCQENGVVVHFLRYDGPEGRWTGTQEEWDLSGPGQYFSFDTDEQAIQFKMRWL